MSKYVNSQLNNICTFNMYFRQMKTLAENVFEFKNLPEFIYTPYLNKCLLEKGSVAFFYDEEMGILALPYTCVNGRDVYGRPKVIQVRGESGYSKKLNPDEYVIMYDNNGQYPLVDDIKQIAERIMLDTRVIDINISAQKTPRIFACPPNMEQTVKKIVADMDSNVDAIVAYQSLTEKAISIISEPAPYVADKIDMHKDKDWNEFLRLIGISNISFEKKERQIKDEIQAMQGGTIASRFSRFEPRQKAVKLINEKFKEYLKKPIEVSYYDGEPTTEEVDESEEMDGDVNDDV